MRRSRTASQRLEGTSGLAHDEGGDRLVSDDASNLILGDAISDPGVNPASKRSSSNNSGQGSSAALTIGDDDDDDMVSPLGSRIQHRTSSREQEFDVRKLDSGVSTSLYGRRRTTRKAPFQNRNRCRCSFSSWRSDVVRLYRRLRTKILFEVQRLGRPGLFFIFLLPCFVDTVWVFLYFAERQHDVQRDNGPCNNPANLPSPYMETPRTIELLIPQCIFSILTLFIWLPFRIFYAGSYKFRHILYMTIVADLVTALPFFVAMCVPGARAIYVPGFLRIWMLRFELGFIYNQTSLKGESVLFITSGIAICVTMVACFEWTQNNFPVREAVFAQSDGDGEYPCTSFAVSIYFIIVTLSTVGFGDVSTFPPFLRNSYSRAVAAISIAVFIVLLPYSVGRIRELLRKSRDRKHLRYVARTHNAHVVVHGHLDDALLGHVLYYFNPVRRARRVVRGQAILHDEGDELHSMLLSEKTTVLGGANYVVAMSENTVSESMLARVSLGYQRAYISLFEGSLLDARDLNRCEILQARAVFVLPTLHVYSDAFYRNAYQGAQGSSSQATAMGMRPMHGADLQRKESISSEDIESACGSDWRTREIFEDMQRGMHRVQHASSARNRLYSRDYRTLLRAWSTHQNIHTDQLLVIVLFHEFNKQFLFDHATHIDGTARRDHSPLMERNLMTISLDAFQQEVLAASCLVPGLSTVITNFFVGEDRGVSVANDGSDDRNRNKPGPDVSYDLELGNHIGHVHSEHHADSDESDADDNNDNTNAAEDGDEAARRNALQKSHNGFLFQSQRHLSRAKLGSASRSAKAKKKNCACGRIDAAPIVTLRNYSRGLQNELEVMVIQSKNPFVGWSRLELAITMHRDFSVIVLAVIREEDAYFTKGEDREIEFFRNAHQEITTGDHVVFLGRGNNLDELFHTRKEDYDIRSGEVPSRIRKRRASRLRTSLLSRTISSNPGTTASPALVSFEGISRAGGTNDGNGDHSHAMMHHQTSSSAAADFFDEENRLEPHRGLPADIDEVSDTDDAPRRSLTSAFVKSWNELSESENGPDSRHRHVILCCPPQSPIEMFVRSLHSRRETDGKPPVWILWLVSAPPSEMIWERICMLPNLVWMLGESCVAHDLLRAGIREASDIVIFSDIFESYIPDVFASSKAVEAADVDRYIISSHRVVTSLIDTFHLKFLRVHTHINSANNGQYLHESSWRRLILDQAFAETVRPQKMASGEKERSNSIWTRVASSLHLTSENTTQKDSVKMLNQLTSSVWPILLNETYAAGESWSASSIFFILFSSYMGGGCGLIFLLVQKLIKLAGKQGAAQGDYNGFRLVQVPKAFHGRPFAELFVATLERNQALCLGLFRGYGHGMNHPKYGKPTILVNPIDMTIAPCDFVYVIGGVKGPRKTPGHMQHASSN
ncbi:Potassium channel subfamily T member 1 [Hondaea fermentalgiana]|uniref:Potassium channel subfamily T member 1 n=1 Tax=Hondaea fermentalgiana TaxID=2315210 RepID=A0A2R5G610_9STRA|nr:Potassium channel subfamily T member 1 [Hondaea fermentalgiana]|eukprot:GBG23883.1 Potassium channel subfamily T member 1 [Hondaea fermentalgiana]